MSTPNVNFVVQSRSDDAFRNAVLHSVSGRPGGHFTVRASLYPGQVRVCPGQLRVEVEENVGQSATVEWRPA